MGIKQHIASLEDEYLFLESQVNELETIGRYYEAKQLIRRMEAINREIRSAIRKQQRRNEE